MRALSKHAKNTKVHKQILMQQSPSVQKLDPLVRKSDRSFMKINKQVSHLNHIV